MPIIEMICLANSRKLGGRCIAGIRTDGGGWVRPVSSFNGGFLYPYQYLLNDGSEPCVFDLIRLELTNERPELYQPENWLFNNTPWTLVARPTPSDILMDTLFPHLVLGPELLGNFQDRISYSYFSESYIQPSLALVFAENFNWEIRLNVKNKRQVRANFILNDIAYNLAVTDPVWEQQLWDLPVGKHPFEAVGGITNQRILLTISLGEPFQGYCYKLIAAVIA